jgi:mannose-6-phosphate isomerase-like protein (cupin superfamily)
MARLEPDSRSERHRLRTAEIYYLVAGQGTMHIDSEAAPVRAGDAVYIPPGATQWLENTGDETVEFVCIVDPAWRPEDEEVLPARK